MHPGAMPSSTSRPGFGVLLRTHRRPHGIQVIHWSTGNCAALRSRNAPSLPRVLIQTSQLSYLLSGIIAILFGELMDHKLTDMYGLQIEQRTENGTPNSANHSNTEIAEVDCNTSTSRPLRRRADTSTGRWASSTSSISRPVTASRSAALRRQGGRPVTANRSAPGFGRQAGLAAMRHIQQVLSRPNRRTRSRASSIKACAASQFSQASSCTTSGIARAASKL